MALRDSRDQRIRSSLLIIGGLGNKVAGPESGCGSGSSHDHCLTGAVKASVGPATNRRACARSGSKKIAHATKPKLKVTKKLLGKRVHVRVTAKRSGYESATARSAQTAKVVKAKKRR